MQILDLCLLIGIVQVKVVGELDCGQGGQELQLTFIGHEEVHQRQELFDVVLERSTSNEQSRCSVEALKRFVQLTLVVFESVRFVDSQILPFDLTEILSVLEDEFVRCQQDVELEVLERPKFELSNNLSRSCRAHIADHIKIRSPGIELHLPSGNGGERDDHEERAVLLLGMEKIR